MKGPTESTMNDRKYLQNLTALQGYLLFFPLKYILFQYRESNFLNSTFFVNNFFLSITAFSNGFYVKRAGEMMAILTALLEQFHLVFSKLTSDL